MTSQSSTVFSCVVSDSTVARTPSPVSTASATRETLNSRSRGVPSTFSWYVRRYSSSIRSVSTTE